MSDLTQTLVRSRSGDPEASEALFAQIYDELRRVAAHYLRQERAGHTLQPTALVHEAYLRAIDQEVAGEPDRAHFFGIAARLMRQILVDHARRRGALKRGGDRARVTLDERVAETPGEALDLLVLDDALERLRALDERKARVVELRFFAGLSMPDVAQILEVSLRSVEADWFMARAWLRGELQEE